MIAKFINENVNFQIFVDTDYPVIYDIVALKMRKLANVTDDATEHFK